MTVITLKSDKNIQKIKDYYEITIRAIASINFINVHLRNIIYKIDKVYENSAIANNNSFLMCNHKKNCQGVIINKLIYTPFTGTFHWGKKTL